MRDIEREKELDRGREREREGKIERIEEERQRKKRKMCCGQWRFEMVHLLTHLLISLCLVNHFIAIEPMHFIPLTEQKAATQSDEGEV